jgi:hypothetical protein
MAESVLSWDTYLSGDDRIRTGPQEAYRIRMIGTDKAGTITPRVDGNDLGAIRTEVAGLQENATNEHGLLHLEDLYYYLPPEAVIEFDGSASDTVRLKGEAIDRPSGRFESSADESRYDEQGQFHYTFVQGSVDTSEPLNDNSETDVFTLTPATDERYEFDGLHMVSQTSDGSYSTSPGELALLFDMDGQQIPSQFGDDTIVGLDIESLPRPPTDSTVQEGFVYGGMEPNVDPLSVLGDQTFTAFVRNTSGGSLGSSSDTTTLTYTATVRFRENL